MIKGAKYKYWIALGVALLLAMAASDVLANNDAAIRQQVKLMFTQDAPAAHAVCASWGGLIATQVDGNLAKVIMEEAKRHYNKVLEVHPDRTYQIVNKAMNLAKESYNTGQFSWGDLNAAAAACAVY